MIAKLRLVFTITIVFASFWGYSQDNYWQQRSANASRMAAISAEIGNVKGKLFEFDANSFKGVLKINSQISKSPAVVYFPDETGKKIAYQVKETPVFAPELSKKYPEIQSYSGIGINDPLKKVRFSVSPDGIQVMMVQLGASKTTYIQKTSKNQYVAYSRSGFAERDTNFVCKTQEAYEKKLSGTETMRPVDDQLLRKYRLAVSASGEFTEFHGGTVVGAMQAINATLTRINLIFETDLAVSLEVVPNNDAVVYVDPETDPYTGNFNFEVQNTLSAEIGEENYDIGHLFHKGENGGSAGFIGKVCVDGQKGSAYSSAVFPSGDIFDIDFVAHELGHQLGANHTWSFESENTIAQVEPGSGSTIMGYAGITEENDVVGVSDDYFHYISIFQISENLRFSSCGQQIALTNNPPEIDPIPDYVIPALTAFELKGTASDIDAGDQLTYAWEQIDAGVVVQGSFGPSNPVGANFRSQIPVTNGSRYFPSLPNIRSGNLTQTMPVVNSAWETVSSISRTMNFAFTVRDNAAGGGQVVSELIQVEVYNTGETFQVDQPSANSSYIAGDIQEIAWNVASTDQSPINTRLVDILLSTDGGFSFPILLAEGVVNDGLHDVQFPGIATANARVMVRANDNVFFAVNDGNFQIIETDYVLKAAETKYDVCKPASLTIPLTYETYSGFSEETAFTVVGLPPGVVANFSPSATSVSGTEVQLTLSELVNADPGNVTITIEATAGAQTKEVPLLLSISDNTFEDVKLQSPANGATDISKFIRLEWEDEPTYSEYSLEIASDASFTTILESKIVYGNSFKPSILENATTYFWRIKPSNSCGEGDFGPPNSFTTVDVSCNTFDGSDLPIFITPNGAPTVVSKVSFYDDLRLVDLDVNLEVQHTYLADLVITLTAPSGKSISLISNSCGELRNINATFDDDASDFLCSGNPAISGVVKPLIGFDAFRGESILGEWTLTVIDTENNDGGYLTGFSMVVCAESEFEQDEDADGVPDSEDLCLGSASGVEVDSTGCPRYRFASDNFQLKVVSESCRTADDGSISINAEAEMNYTVVITGNNFDSSGSFIDAYVQNSLKAGSYKVCITGTEETKNFEEVCFDLSVTQPEALTVLTSANLSEGSVLLALNGSDNYFIELNEELIQTTASEISIDLKAGHNRMKVSGDLSCQGAYEEQFFRPTGIILHPNPTTDFVSVYVENSGAVAFELYSIDGRLMFFEEKILKGNETELNISSLPAGNYILKIKEKSQTNSFKIVKQ